MPIKPESKTTPGAAMDDENDFINLINYIANPGKMQ